MEEQIGDHHSVEDPSEQIAESHETSDADAAGTRRKFIRGALAFGAGAVLGEVAAAGAAQAPRPQRPGGGPTLQTNVPPPFRVKVLRLEYPPDNPTLGRRVPIKLFIETSGGGTKDVPWAIYRNDTVVGRGTKPQVPAGTTFEVSAEWSVVEGTHRFYGEVDPDNTLNEPRSERRNNITDTTEVIRRPYRLKVRGLDVTGGTSPGDAQTLRLVAEATGDKAGDVDWRITRGGEILAQGVQRAVAGGTTFTTTAAWTAQAGEHKFEGWIDRNNLYAEPEAERADNRVEVVKVYTDWSKWMRTTRTAVRSAVGQWVSGARLNGVDVNAVTATGGSLTGPPLQALLMASMAGTGMPTEVLNGLSGGIGEAWTKWASSVKLPGLPLYPAFAAFPGPVAPPTPSIPTPLASLTQDLNALGAQGMAATINRRLGNAAQWPGASDAVSSFCRWFGSGIAAWMATAMVTNILGGGPIPTFAPPYVPVGPVVGGKGDNGQITGAITWPPDPA